jgi:hypothetical protein
MSQQARVVPELRRLNLSSEEVNLSYTEPIMNTPTGSDSHDMEIPGYKGPNLRSFTYIVDSEDLRPSEVVRLDKSRLLDIKPRFSSEIMRLQLLERFREAKQAPAKVFEIALYQISKIYNMDLQGGGLSIAYLDFIHHIYQLKQDEGVLPTEELEVLNQNLETNLEMSPKALTGYKLFREITTLVSALSIKWKVAKFENFGYRCSPRVANVKLLCLSTLNEDLYTIEGLWLAVAIKYSPLSEIIDDNVLQFAHFLRQATDKLMSALVFLNSEADFLKTPSLEGYYAANDPELAALMNWEPDFLASAIEHHCLELPRGVFASCFKDKYYTINKQLKGLIEDFDVSYRNFEQSLIRCLLVETDPDDKAKSLYS